MFNYEDHMKASIIQVMDRDIGFNRETPEMGMFIKDCLQNAFASKKLKIPKAAIDHGMPLAQALADLKSKKSPEYYLNSLVLWMTRAHLQDLDRLCMSLKRQYPDSTSELLAPVAANQARMAAVAGNFDLDHPTHSDLAHSNWNDARHELSFKKWEAIITATSVGQMRLGVIRRPLSPVHIPGFMEIEMRIPSGRLLISSSVPVSELDDKIVAMRQKGPHGLKGDLEITNAILDDHNIIALPVHARSLSFMKSDYASAIVVEKDPDVRNDDVIASTLLDYRYLTICDEAALIENMRTSWNEPIEDAKARYDAARAASTADVETVQIEPGTYRITLPANYAHELPSKMDIYGEPDDVIVHFEKIK